MHHRVRLLAEILIVYGPLLRRLRADDLPTLVAAARGTSGPRLVTPAKQAHGTAVRMGIFVQRVLERLPTDNRCLIRSLVLLRLLDQRSVPVQIVIGVRSEDRFAAHAWIEHDGVPVLPSHGFARLLEL